MAKGIHNSTIRAQSRIVTTLQTWLGAEIAAAIAELDTLGITVGAADALDIKTPAAAAYYTVYSDEQIDEYVRNYDPVVLVWLNSDEELGDLRSGSPSLVSATQEFEIVVMIAFGLVAFQPFTYNAKPMTFEESMVLTADVYNAAVMNAILKKACGSDDVLSIATAGRTRDYLAPEDDRPLVVTAATKWTIKQDVTVPQPQ